MGVGRSEVRDSSGEAAQSGKAQQADYTEGRSFKFRPKKLPRFNSDLIAELEAQRSGLSLALNRADSCSLFAPMIWTSGFLRES